MSMIRTGRGYVSGGDDISDKSKNAGNNSTPDNGGKGDSRDAEVANPAEPGLCAAAKTFLL